MHFGELFAVQSSQTRSMNSSFILDLFILSSKKSLTFIESYSIPVNTLSSSCNQTSRFCSIHILETVLLALLYFTLLARNKQVFLAYKLLFKQPKLIDRKSRKQPSNKRQSMRQQSICQLKIWYKTWRYFVTVLATSCRSGMICY